jgi:outer membrane immunogenic protein
MQTSWCATDSRCERNSRCEHKMGSVETDRRIVLEDWNMKSLRIAVVAIASLTGLAAASAADLPPRPEAPPPPPLPVVAPIYNWTGFYIGANAGGVWANSTITESISGVSTNTNRVNGTGGLQAGYNYEFMGGFLLGLEGTINWSGRNSQTNTFVVGGTNFNVSGGGATQMAATIVGRFGFAMDRVLFYGKGGWGWAQPNWQIVDASNGAVWTGTGWQNGYTLGAGIEYALTRNWTMRIEYDYLGLANWQSGTTIVGPTSTATIRGSLSEVLVGVNYKF